MSTAHAFQFQHRTPPPEVAAELPTQDPQLFGRMVSESYDESDNTMEMVWTTGATVRRWEFDWSRWEFIRVEETLSLDDGAVELDRLNNGAPFLVQHNATTDDTIGRIVDGSARIEGEGDSRRGLARVRFSTLEQDANRVEKIRTGLTPNTSVGYEYLEVEDTIHESDGTRWIERNVTRWRPYEVSSVAMGADDGAMFRARYQRAAEAIRERYATATRPTTPPVEDPTMSERNQPTTPTPEATPAKPGTPRHLTDVSAWQEREVGIRAAATRLGVDMTHERLAPLLDPKSELGRLGLDGARSRMFDLAADLADDKPTRATSNLTVGDDLEEEGKAIRSEGMRLAILERAVPGKAERYYRSSLVNQYGQPLAEADAERRMAEIRGAAQAFRFRSLIQLAERTLVDAGQFREGMSPAKIARRALQLRAASGGHTSSDFSAVLGDSANIIMRAAYAEIPVTYPTWAERTTARNFKEQHRPGLGGAPDLLPFAENGEIQKGSTTEVEERFKLSPYGRRFPLTWEMIVNDDFGVFSSMIARFGARARVKESSMVVAPLVNNQVMLEDSKGACHADHNNLASAHVGAPDKDSINELLTLMDEQTMPVDNGEAAHPTYAPGKFLLVPPTHRMAAADHTVNAALVNATKAADVLGNTITDLIPIVEPALAGAPAWWILADYNIIPTIQYAYLEGDEGLQTETRRDPNGLGVEVWAWLAFAARIVEYRGIAKNAGA